MDLLAWTIISIFLSQAESARILAAFPHTGKSHYFMFKPFVYKLAELGHQVHVITYFPDQSPPANLTFIDLQSKDRTKFFTTSSIERFEILSHIHKYESLAHIVQGAAVLNALQNFGVETCKYGLGHPNLQKFLKEEHEFDLLIVEYFNTDCFASLAHVYNVPLIGIFSSTFMPFHNDRFGNPDNPAYIPNLFSPYSSRMTFVQRLVNTYFIYFSKLFYRIASDNPADDVVKKYIGDNIPPVREIVKNTSLFLINTHFSLFQPRPLVPSIIELGGFHLSPPGKIPSDILQFIEEARTGVIFFSFGSTIRGASLPQYKLQIIQNVISTMPYRILWKWEEDEMPGKPSNVMIRKWFPQNEILSHPKVKLFITHSGLMGTEEAVYHGVPMLMMPISGDQPVNAAACEEKGIGVILNYYTLTGQTFREALYTVLEDRSYAENAKRLSSIFKDRPISTMDSAVYWTEYVIRHKGARHLRSAAIDLPWYQEFLLDVIAFTCIALYISYKVSVLIVKLGFCRRRPKVGFVSPKKKKN